MGSRYDKGTNQRVEQGTKAYQDTVIGNMKGVYKDRDTDFIANNPNSAYAKEMAALNKTLVELDKYENKIDYHVVRQGFDTEGEYLAPVIKTHTGN